MNTFKARMGYSTTLKRFYVLSKPGIIYANIITTLAGYLLASEFHIHFSVLTGLIVGVALTIAGACSYNNYLDRKIDLTMVRTKKRSLVTGDIAGWQALLYATLITVIGVTLLAVTQNWLTTVLIVVAFVDYVALYGLAKRKSVHGTLVGCVSGAIPLVAGYTAVTARLDLGAWLLFIVMVAWQMAHFYGIALYRLTDYQAAHIPVMPAVKGVKATKVQILIYIVAFIGACVSLGVFNYIGVVASVLLAALGVAWLVRALQNYQTLPADIWGRKVFLFSLIVMLWMSIMLSVGPLLA